MISSNETQSLVQGEVPAFLDGRGNFLEPFVVEQRRVRLHEPSEFVALASLVRERKCRRSDRPRRVRVFEEERDREVQLAHDCGVFVEEDVEAFPERFATVVLVRDGADHVRELYRRTPAGTAPTAKAPRVELRSHHGQISIPR